MKQLNSWFEKLKLKGTAGRASNANGNESETQSTISLPRSSYYRYRYAASASSNNNNNSHRNNSRLCGEMPAFRSAGDDNAVLSQILFPNRKAEDYSGHKAQPGLVESSVSAGCSCRAGIAAYSPSKRKNKRNKNTKKKKKELKAVPMTVFSAMDGGQRDAAKPVKARNKVIADETKFQELEKQEKDDANHFLRGDSNRCSALCCSCRLSVCPSFRQDESSAGIVNLDLWSDDESEADELPFLSSRESVCNCRNINRNSVVLDMKLRWGPFCDIGETAATLFRRPDAVDSHAQAEAKIRQMILNNNESSLSTFIPPKNQDPANGNSRIGQATAKTERSGFRHCKQAVNRGHYNPSFEQVSCRGSHRPGNNAAADYHSVNVSRRERCFRLNDCQPHTDNFIRNPIYDDLQHGRTYFPDDLKSVDSKWWDDMVMSESSVKEYECEMNMPPRNSVAVSYNDNASRKSEDAALWLHSVNSVAVSYNDNASRKSDDAALRPHFMKCGSCGQPKSKLAQSKVRKSTDYPAISDLDSETESLLENLVESEASSAAAATANEGEAEADAEAEEETDARKKISESFAMVKSSYNPERDFRESMLEMIFENDIRDPRDLQELLDCYISLNSKEYHPVILHVFQQIESRLLQMASV